MGYPELRFIAFSALMALMLAGLYLLVPLIERIRRMIESDLPKPEEKSDV